MGKNTGTTRDNAGTTRNYAGTRLDKYQAIKNAIPLTKIHDKNGNKVYWFNFKYGKTDAVLIDYKPVNKGGTLLKGMVVDFSDSDNVQVFRGRQENVNTVELGEKYTLSNKGNGYKQYGSRWMKHELVLLPYLMYSSDEGKGKVDEWGYNPIYQINHLENGDLDTADVTHLEIVTAEENKRHRTYWSDLSGYVAILSGFEYRLTGLTANQVVQVYKAVEHLVCGEDLYSHKEEFLEILLDMGVLCKWRAQAV